MKANRKNKGFTLVETLVAISILLIGIVAPITAINSAVNASRIAEDRVFAYYLAQEAVEYIRYARDTNIVRDDGGNWMSHMDECLVGSGGPCELRSPLINFDAANPNAFADCAVDDCTIGYNAGQNIYGRSGPATNFEREIVLNGVDTDVEIPLTVTVKWSRNGQDYTYVLQEVLFNWSGN